MNHEVNSLFDDRADQEAFEDHEAALTEHDRALELRDLAIDRAETHADPLWFEEALEAVEHCARAERVFTSEDAARLMNRATHEPRAWGAVFRVAKDHGWISPTDRFVAASSPSRHRAPIRTWRSNLFIGERAA